MDIKNALRSNWARIREHSAAGFLLRLGWFLILYLIAGQLYSIIISVLVKFIPEDVIHNPLLWIIYNTSVKFWGLFYPNLSTTAGYIVRINHVDVIQLFSPCSGLNALFRITIILLLYPLPWKTKFWLFPLSWFIILIAATIHFILLIPIACQWPDWYSFSHNWLTRIVFYGFYFLTWLMWEKVGYREK